MYVFLSVAVLTAPTDLVHCSEIDAADRVVPSHCTFQVNIPQAELEDADLKLDSCESKSLHLSSLVAKLSSPWINTPSISTSHSLC